MSDSDRHAAPMLDSHQHFWRLSRGDYGWLTPSFAAIYRDFEPSDLRPQIARCAVGETIAVQAAPTVDETRFLLQLAEQHEFIAGVVGWVDFEAPNVADVLTELRTHKKLVGVRPMLQDIDDPQWILRPALAPAFDALLQAGLTFDALVRAHQLPVVLELAQRYPNLTIILDHAAKPDIANRRFDVWAEDIRALSRASNVTCKLSGLVTEAGTADYDSLAPYVAHVLECFGPERIMWGSDWPVCTLVCDYSTWFDLSQRLTAHLSPTERASIFGNVARRIYGLKQP